MNGFQIGMAKTDITPPLGTLLYGYPGERAAKEVLDPLSVGVLAIRGGDKLILLVNVETCLMDNQTHQAIRRQVAEVAGVSPGMVLCCATHTHSGPITKSSAGWGVADTSYIRQTLVPRAAATAERALAAMAPAVMAIGKTESLAGINRRQTTADGQVILGQNPQGPYDPTMTVIRFQTPAGEPLGNVIHYAVHPTAAGGNLSITRDWPGHMVDKLEALSGAPCMFFNGAQGDVGPRLASGRTTGDNDAVAEIGRIAAADVAVAYERAAEFYAPRLYTYEGQVCLHYAPAPAYEEVLRRMEAMGDPAKLIEVAIREYAQLVEMKTAYEEGQPFPEQEILAQTVVALDDLALATSPFETFCQVSLDIQKASPFGKTLLLGLCNGDYGYLPTADQLSYGGYEVDSFRAAGLTGFREDTAQLLAEGNVALLKALYNTMK